MKIYTKVEGLLIFRLNCLDAPAPFLMTQFKWSQEKAIFTIVLLVPPSGAQNQPELSEQDACSPERPSGFTQGTQKDLPWTRMIGLWHWGLSSWSSWDEKGKVADTHTPLGFALREIWPKLGSSQKALGHHSGPFKSSLPFKQREQPFIQHFIHSTQRL